MKNKMKMKSRDRNKPCPCRSGKKTKKCFPFHNQPQVIDVKNIDYINYEMKQDEEFLYHIVHKEIYVKFKDVGLKGGGYPWKGYLYCLDTDDKKYWNGISSTNVGDGFLSHNKPYVVIGIPKNLLKENNIEMELDPMTEGDMTGVCHRRVNLGEKYIHPNSYKIVYEGITDMKEYECEDRWDIMMEKMKEDKSLSEEQKMRTNKSMLVINDSIFGRIHYSERYKKHTQVFLKNNPSFVQGLKQYEGLPHSSHFDVDEINGMDGDEFLNNQITNMKSELMGVN